MSPKILRRCDLCGNFHASYLVDEPELGGKRFLCQACWKARYAPPKPPQQDAAPTAPPPEDDSLLNKDR